MRLRSIALIATLLIAGIAAAHHGWSEYESRKTLTLIGTIRESGYSNPHGFVRLHVGRAKGKTWKVILAPPARMKLRGLEATALKAGTRATVVGYPHRTKKAELRAERITIAGKTTELR